MGSNGSLASLMGCDFDVCMSTRFVVRNPRFVYRLLLDFIATHAPEGYVSFRATTLRYTVLWLYALVLAFGAGRFQTEFSGDICSVERLSL